MLNRVMITLLAAVFFALGATAMNAAESGNEGAGGGGQNRLGPGGGNGGGSEFCVLNPGDAGLSQAESDALLFMREEEKVAHDSYVVLGGLWGLVVFGNISDAEQDHMDAVKALVDCYRLTDPVIGQVGTFFNSDLQNLFDALMTEGRKSAMDGLFVGALIEETDIVDLQASIGITTHEHIVSTYESIMCGSRNHLRAFIRQIENNGGSYEPSVLDAEVFWEIAYSPMERDCGEY